jgi:hypothetical protein
MGLIHSNHIDQFKSLLMQFSLYNKKYIPPSLYFATLSINDLLTVIQFFEYLSYSIREKHYLSCSRETLIDIICEILAGLKPEDLPPTKIGPVEFMGNAVIDYLYNCIIYSRGRDINICEKLFIGKPDMDELHKLQPKIMRLYVLSLLSEKNTSKRLDTYWMYLSDVIIDIVEIVQARIIDKYRSEGKTFDRLLYKQLKSEMVKEYILTVYISRLSFKTIPTEYLGIVKSKFLQIMHLLLPKEYWYYIYYLINKQKYDILQFLSDNIFGHEEIEHLINVATEDDESRRRVPDQTKMRIFLKKIGYSLEE